MVKVYNVKQMTEEHFLPTDINESNQVYVCACVLGPLVGDTKHSDCWHSLFDVNFAFCLTFLSLPDQLLIFISISVTFVK